MCALISLRSRRHRVLSEKNATAGASGQRSVGKIFGERRRLIGPEPRVSRSVSGRFGAARAVEMAMEKKLSEMPASELATALVATERGAGASSRAAAPLQAEVTQLAQDLTPPSMRRSPSRDGSSF